MSIHLSKARQVGIPVAMGVVGPGVVLTIVYLLQGGAIPLWPVSTHALVNLTATMQGMAFAVSLVALAGVYLYDRAAFRKFFRSGITLSEKDNGWSFFGPVMAIAFTLGTTMLMSFSITAQHGTVNGTFWQLMPLVVLFAATNAWNEEILYRFVIIAGLDGKVSAGAICWISGLFFGLSHFYGTPSGISGVIMSGVFGGLQTKSVVDTRGMGWALLIHFLQDVVIFGAGAMVLAGQQQ